MTHEGDRVAGGHLGVRDTHAGVGGLAVLVADVAAGHVGVCRLSHRGADRNEETGGEGDSRDATKVHGWTPLDGAFLGSLSIR